MDAKHKRYEVATWHGEHGSTFSVVDTLAPEDDHPAVVVSVRSSVAARFAVNMLNAVDEYDLSLIHI